MASYATTADVNALAPQALFSATSRPSLTQVQLFVDDGTNVINATLANIGYVTPITGTIALAECKKANAWYALGIAQQVRDTAVATATSDKGTPGKNIWTRMFEEWLARLVDPRNPFELPDAPRNNEQLEKQPDQVLRSMAQGLSDDADYSVDAPAVTRYQVL
jgi:hypothetical protein